MNRVFLNHKPIAEFDNEDEAIYFAGQVVMGEQYYKINFPYTPGTDIVEVECEEGIVEIKLSDIEIDGIKLG